MADAIMAAAFGFVLVWLVAGDDIRTILVAWSKRGKK